MTFGTMERIQTVTVGSGGAANIEFTNIPQTYDDLVVKMSGRLTTSGYDTTPWVVGAISLNGTQITSGRLLFGNGSAAGSDTNSSPAFITDTNATANTFASMDMYLPNYRSTTNKSVSIDVVGENNGTSSVIALQAVLSTVTSAVTSITFTANNTGLFAQHSTATLYGITRVPAGAKATGGVIYDDANFWYHVFTSTGTFTPSQNLSCDVLAIGGGGGSGSGTNVGAGGGAGGLLYATSKSFASSTNFTVTIGAGGGPDASGANTTIDNITAFGGGRGGDEATVGGNGGSGGGSTWASGLNTPGTSTQTNNGGGTGYGNAGGSNTVGAGSNHYPSGGGGGAGAVGGNGTSALQGGNGGAGLGGNTLSALNAFGAATSTGVLSGGNYFYAGGGGGGSWQGSTTWSSGGIGGGGRGGANIAGGDNPTNGLANTGGGGGGNGASAVSGRSGGSGIIIVRYAK